MNLIFNAVWRRALKNKINLGINLLGLIIGMIAFVFIFSWVRSERSYDQFWDGASQTYRVTLKRTGNGKELQNIARNYNGVGPVLQNELPEVEAATHLDKDIITVFTPRASVPNINMFFTDSSFFKVFRVLVESENPKLLFTDIHSAIISRSLAVKLFGDQNPLNQTFKLNEGWEFYVCGVFDDVPENSHIKFDLILQRKALLYYMRNFDYATGKLDNSKLASWVDRDPYSQGQWRGTRGYTYIRLKPGADINQVKAKYQDVIAPCIQHIRENNEDVQFEFQPITQIHLTSHKNGEMFANGSSIRVLAFSIIGILLILTSFLNFVNISVASSINQTGSRSIHRILGAAKHHLYIEYFVESFLIHLFAGVVAFAVAVVSLTSGNLIWGFRIFPMGLGELALICFLLVLLGAVLTSIYPSLYLSRLARKRAKNLKANGERSSSIKALVVFQFGVSIFLIIGTISIFRQIQFMQNTDTGMNIEQTMVSFSPMTMIKKPDLQERLRTFRNELAMVPGVKGFTTSEIAPGKNYDRFSNEVWLHGSERNKSPFALANIEPNYFDFFSIKLLVGKTFLSTSQPNGDEVIINQSACSQLGVSPNEAVNKMVMINNNAYRIIGVADDYHHLSLKDEIQPVIYFHSFYWFRSVGFYFVKIAPQNRQATIKKVAQVWNNIYPQEDYYYTFLDDRFNEAYSADINFGRIYLGMSILTIFIACMGLFALANFSSKARVKEIGIRKVNGAKVSEVLAMLNKDFVKWVVISFVIATPIAWFIMNKWLENFAYKVTMSWWIFALAGILALGIALLTVTFQSWKAATRNPVEALRYE